jgi:hypothetical protein
MDPLDSFVWLEVSFDQEADVQHFINFFAIAKARGVGPSYRIHRSKRMARFVLPSPLKRVDNPLFLAKCHALGVYGSIAVEDSNGCLFILPSTDVKHDFVITGDELTDPEHWVALDQQIDSVERYLNDDQDTEILGRKIENLLTK